VAQSETVKAIAVRADGSSSPVASFAYVISPPPTPTGSPAPGTYTSETFVALIDAEPGAMVHYTTNGSTPTAASPTDPNPVDVASSMTIKAIAVRANGVSSSVASLAYVLPAQAAPGAGQSAAAPKAGGGSPASAKSPVNASSTSGEPLAVSAINLKKVFALKLVRRHGLTFSIGLPANAHGLHLRILRLARAHRRTTSSVVFTTDLVTPALAGDFPVTVKGAKRLVAGVYVLEVSLRDARGATGTVSRSHFRLR
jgi:hypothetical protein